ncbi:SPFH domain-containing protein [Anaeromicropila populeti]|uniref:SPFH domain / Band 7 family protein n=1 Tax=Anaeromicropila populeti TaxID=37658 RepID=A0A1I6JAE8_9FIRM|nr:SPFH domain-containing protein [Anaeromicropila populeti]SFR75959.1 SPFH domain / Band 7 family protein [Anaeromicropila populeti]
MKRVKILLFVATLVVMAGSMASCKPYDKPEFVEITASQTAFLIPLVGDTSDQAVFESEELLEKTKVATKRVRIPHEWVKKGRMPSSGEYMPTETIIIVERKPETREWTSEKDKGTSAVNQAIYAESKESIGFSVGMNCTAQIDEKNATKFLYRYNNKTLSDIMDTEIRARVESDFVEQCAKYTLNEILQNKEIIMNYVRDDVTSYFSERGITINNLGMKEGLTYEDETIQQAINDKFSSEQKIVTQKNNNKVILSKAQAEADAKILAAEADAKSNKLLSASITQELIDMKLAEARLANGWVTVDGAGTTIVDAKDNK